MGWRTDTWGVEITTLSRRTGAAGGPSAFEPTITEIALPGPWAALATYATATELQILERLSAASVALSEMGIEADGGIPLSFAWADARVGIALDLNVRETGSLTGDGWTLLDPQSDDLAAQVAALTGGN